MKIIVAILSIYVSFFASVYAGSLPKYDHVVIVMMENHSYSQIIGYSGAPYLNNLADSGMLFTASYALTHPSQPNYVDIFSGTDQGITDDNVSPNAPFTTANFGAELIANGYTFAGYAEGLPSVGYTGATYGSYARKHCPWINWQGNGANQISSSLSLPYSSFPTDFAKLPTVSFVIPNLDDDMHDGTVPEGDTWSKNNLNAYANWAKNHNSLLIITWDEDNDSDGNHIATIFYGANVIKGQNGVLMNHYNILRTIEDMYGLNAIANSSNVASINDVWTTTGIKGTSPEKTALDVSVIPFENTLNIQFTGNMPAGNVNLTLLDMNGKEITQTTFSGTGQYLFHIPACPAGCYILVASGSDFTLKRKVVIGE